MNVKIKISHNDSDQDGRIIMGYFILLKIFAFFRIYYMLMKLIVKTDCIYFYYKLYTTKTQSPPH